MVHSAPDPVPAVGALDRWKIELKVIASTAVTFVVSTVVAVLNAIQDDHALLGSLPSPVQFIVLAVIPTLATFASGYLAKHTPRTPDGG